MKVARSTDWLFRQSLWRHHHDKQLALQTVLGKTISSQTLRFFWCVSFMSIHWYPRCIFVKVSNSNLKSDFLERLKFERFQHVKNLLSLIATHYLSYVAAAVTTLLCLLVISLESLICSFANLFPCCWRNSEWLHRPGQASVSVAFGAAGFTKGLFSLRGEEEGRYYFCQ